MEGGRDVGRRPLQLRILHGEPLAAAASAALALVGQAGGLGGAICIDPDGTIAVPLTTEVMYRARRCSIGSARVIRARLTAVPQSMLLSPETDHSDPIEASFRTLPERYAGAQPGFDATYRIVVGDRPAREMRCTEREAIVRERATKRPADVVFESDAPTWLALRRGELSATEALRERRLRASGRLDLVIAFEGLFRLEDGRPPVLHVRDVKVASGLRISTLTLGEGPDVLMIHGLGSTKGSFLDAAAILSRHYRVHVIDMPGFGSSSKPACAPYSTGWLAEAVCETLDALHVERAHVAGHSLGGRVAIELGLRHPKRVAGLALLSPAVAGAKRSCPPLVRLVRPELALLPHRFTRGMIEQTFQALFADPERVDPGLVDLVVDDFRRTYESPGARVAFLAAIRQIYLDEPFGPDGFYPRLAKLAAPSLFVWGTHDTVIPATMRHHVSKWLPSAEQVVLGDTGHAPQVEHPEWVSELLHRQFATADAAVGERRGVQAQAQAA